MIITVLTSASASTQTTILPTARTTLSMARWGAIPKAFGRVHPRFFTPSFSTLLMGALSIIWTVALLAFNPSQNVLGDTISALGFAICFYYGFTGLACPVYFRRDLFRSLRNFFLAGLIPVVGGLMMGYIGVVLMFASWPFFSGYFSRRWLEAADPAVLEADAAHRKVTTPGEPDPDLRVPR